jgi:mannose-6-phosphate isomerase-like protein (cupin superfamily)
MRLLVSLTLAPFVVAAALAADAPTGVQYRKAAEVDAVRASGDTGGLIITDPEFKVLAGRRDKPGQAEVHATDTDIFIVIDGQATIVLGGEVIDGKETGAGEIRGSGIRNGTDYLLEKGVVLTVPHGTPHWVRETKPGFRYYVVKSVARH